MLTASPYRELEIYLDQVSNEIGAALETSKKNCEEYSNLNKLMKEKNKNNRSNDLKNNNCKNTRSNTLPKNYERRINLIGYNEDTYSSIGRYQPIKSHAFEENSKIPLKTSFNWLQDKCTPVYVRSHFSGVPSEFSDRFNSSEVATNESNSSDCSVGTCDTEWQQVPFRNGQSSIPERSVDWTKDPNNNGHYSGFCENRFRRSFSENSKSNDYLDEIFPRKDLSEWNDGHPEKRIHKKNDEFLGYFDKSERISYPDIVNQEDINEYSKFNDNNKICYSEYSRSDKTLFSDYGKIKKNQFIEYPENNQPRSKVSDDSNTFLSRASKYQSDISSNKKNRNINSTFNSYNEKSNFKCTSNPFIFDDEKVNNIKYTTCSNAIDKTGSNDIKCTSRLEVQNSKNAADFETFKDKKDKEDTLNNNEKMPSKERRSIHLSLSDWSDVLLSELGLLQEELKRELDDDQLSDGDYDEVADDENDDDIKYKMTSLTGTRSVTSLMREPRDDGAIVGESILVDVRKVPSALTPQYCYLKDSPERILDSKSSTANSSEDCYKRSSSLSGAEAVARPLTVSRKLITMPGFNWANQTGSSMPCEEVDDDRSTVSSTPTTPSSCVSNGIAGTSISSWESGSQHWNGKAATSDSAVWDCSNSKESASWTSCSSTWAPRRRKMLAAWGSDDRSACSCTAGNQRRPSYLPLSPSSKKPSKSSSTPTLNFKTLHRRKHTKFEIEANEACRWLKAAGFPQYVHMYQQLQLPIDVNGVAQDHPMLEADTLQSLYRRLHTLNHCAPNPASSNSYLFVPPGESDSEVECALSKNWLYDSDSGKWSRITEFPYTTQPSASGEFSCDTKPSTFSSLCASTSDDGGDSPLASKFRRTGSERLKEGAKALLRRVESFKSRNRRTKNKDETVVSSLKVPDPDTMESRVAEADNSPKTEASDESKKNNSSPPTTASDDNGNHLTVPQTRYEYFDYGESEKSTSISQHSPSLSSVDKESESVVSVEGSQNEIDKHGRRKVTVVRWHSLRDSAPVVPQLDLQRSMTRLTVGQLQVLKKLALLKLTSIMEKYCPNHRVTGWSWDLPKFIKRSPDYRDKKVFGVPLWMNLQQNGSPLPRNIYTALSWLQVNGLQQVGIFRKPGVRSRIYKLRLIVESRPLDVNFDKFQVYDVADLVKQYFRELPDPLITNKMSQTFVSISQHVPEDDPARVEAMHCALLLLPDEHREALIILLSFLHEVSKSSEINQMTSSNLAVCLAPSLFYWSGNTPTSGRSCSSSPRNAQKLTTTAEARELGHTKAAHECLNYLIKNFETLLVSSEEMMNKCQFNYLDYSVPVSLSELGDELNLEWKGYLEMCRKALLKESRECMSNRGWTSVVNYNGDAVEMWTKKVKDGHPLKVWRMTVEVDTSPPELLYRLLRERFIWDDSLVTYSVVRKLSPNAELFHYANRSSHPLPVKDYCVVRSWFHDEESGKCTLVETSVEEADVAVVANGVRAIVLASRYLIEPLAGGGRSKLTHLSRVDTKGRSPEWYNKCYGHACSRYLNRIQQSFQRIMVRGAQNSKQRCFCHGNYALHVVS